MDPRTGGPCQGIRNSFESMKMLGVNLEVVCLDSDSDSTLWQDPFKIHAIGKGISPWYYNKALYLWLINNLLRFDFVITHGLWQYQSYAVSKALRELKKKGFTSLPRHYVMPHGMLDPWFQTEPSRWLKSIRNWTYWKLIESTTIQNADGVLFTSEEEMTLARATFSPYKPKKEINVGYGIEAPPEFSMSMMEAFYMRSPQVENKKYWLFLSRIHPKKGLDILIKAYTILAEKDEYKNHLPDMVIAGPGMETSFGRKVKKKVHNNQTLISKVHFVGMLTGAAKWGAIYGCDAFVLPSHQENFSIAVVEAMACSNAVLISNQVNIWREIQSGGGGIIAEDNINGVVQQLQQFLQLDPILRSKMRFNARNTFENHFIVANAAKQLFNTIKA